MILASCLLACSAHAAGPSSSEKKVTLPQYLHDRTGAVLDQVANDHDYPKAIASLQAIFDQAVVFAPANDPDSIREADFSLLLVSQLNQLTAETRDPLLPYLRKHDDLAHKLVFLIKAANEDPQSVYALLNQLRQKRGDELDTFSNLAAAVCVVHNLPLSQTVNENSAMAIDPITIFDFYVANENRMFFGLRNVPAELLVYVVDTTASLDEMQWALNRYAGTADVGGLYSAISYDYDALKTGVKKLTTAGFNLPNILKYGGVCIDQAYFSATVGKALGVPTAIDIGESGESAHAWVGFLQYNGRDGFWNFDTGRYQNYQGVRGTVRDPQTRQDIPDCFVTLLGQIIGTRAVDRQNAVALTDAAGRLSELGGDNKASAVVAPSPDTVFSSTFLNKPREMDVAAQLALIQSALTESVAYIPAWFYVRDLAVQKKLTLEQKRRWSDVLIRLGAAKFPDFTLSILMPMVNTVDDPDQQNSLLANLLPLFQARSDLSAAIIMSQAELWEANNQDDRAGQCYMSVIQRYGNDGPFVLRALEGAEALLKKTNRADKVVVLYQQAWSQMAKPGDWAPQFVAESNWYRIGEMYEQKLSDAGDATDATQVKSALAAVTGAAANQ